MPPSPPRKFWISDLLRLFLVYSWVKFGPPTAKPGCCVEARRIKGVTPLRAAAEAAKQVAIRVRCGKISVLILITCRHP